MDFSIIVPVFQTYNIFCLFIDSIKKTITMPTQIILINDGSELQVENEINSLCATTNEKYYFEAIHHRYSHGCAKSINEGFQLAKGEIIVLLDSDLVLTGNWQEQIHKTIADESVGAVGAVLLYPQTGGIQNCGLVFSEDASRHLFLNSSYSRISNRMPYEVQSTVFAFCAIKRQIMVLVGEMDEKFFNGYEDLDYQLRIQEKGFKIVINPQVIAYHWEKSNGIHRSFNRKSNLARLWRKHGTTIKHDSITFLEIEIGQLSLLPSQKYIGLDFLQARSEASALWSKLKEYILFQDIYDYSYHNIAGQELWLPQILDKDFFTKELPFVFLCDNFITLLDNYYWFDLRRNIRCDDIIVDLYNNVLYFRELEMSFWPGRKIR